jgi:hypothetical protein
LRIAQEKGVEGGGEEGRMVGGKIVAKWRGGSEGKKEEGAFTGGGWAVVPTHLL